MLQLIKNVALILDDKQSFSYLENTENNDNFDQSNIKVYVALANFVIRNIAANFQCFFTSEKLISNQSSSISFSSLSYQPCKIKRLKNFFGKSVGFDLNIDSILVPTANEQYTIEYAYFPDEYKLEDTILLPLGLDTNTICFGVASELYSLKSQPTEAAVWEIKFRNGLKNLLGKHYDRRLHFRGL